LFLLEFLVVGLFVSQNVECRFFDECIDAKENRSMFLVTKKGTPFLSMNRYAPTEVYQVLLPDAQNLPEGAVYKYDRFPSLQ
jgi:hypothetical protein